MSGIRWSGKFWPQGTELIFAGILVCAISFSGYYTYSHILSKIESESRLPSCFSSSSFDQTASLIPCDQIYHAGPTKDGIPALTHPAMVAVEQAQHLSDSDPVIGIEMDGQSRAYPLRIMAWHECVNDSIGNNHFAVFYCPLCDSTAVYDRCLGEEILEFGISGLIYQSNLLFFDRRKLSGKESLWSQLNGKAVVGPLSGKTLVNLPHQRVTWKTWKSMHPNTTVLDQTTGYKRSYSPDFYADYFAKDDLLYPVEIKNDLFPLKERVLGVVAEGTAKAYPLKRIDPKLREIRDSIGKISIRIKRLDSEDSLIEADAGAHTVYSFWFAWYAFHPDTQIYDGEGFDLEQWRNQRISSAQPAASVHLTQNETQQ